ncbi:hypothetical protein GQ44DRAFT_769951 [Phaeosphaeriaceae sp. PMI808]|nr:hypothetical protein GQ44DRAFT_769951 [Phaeosphaeriaceae sp. PMI808]
MRTSILFNLAAALPAVHAIAFGGPVPTDISPHRALDGISPKPTTAPSVNELRKRLSRPETCGWVDGQLSSAVACSAGRSCMLYKSGAVGMAGCCLGSDTQECGWSNSCVDYSKFAAGSCGSSCLLNTFIRKCTNIAAPYCVTWTYPVEGIADYGCESTSVNTVYTVRSTASNALGVTTSTRLPTVAAAAVSIPTGSSRNGGSTRTTKKITVGAIIGIVVAVLVLLFFVIIGVVMFLKKKKKQQQLAANTQAVAAAQANRPQSQYQPPPPPQMQQGPPPQQPYQGMPPPMPPQSPQPPMNGYFPPPVQQEQKYNGHTSVHEYAMSPISNPSTPAPAYSQPFAPPNVPPMPQQHTGQYQPPANGAHEVGSAGVSQPPQQYMVSPLQQATPSFGAQEVHANSTPHAPGRSGPVYEMGGK